MVTNPNELVDMIRSFYINLLGKCAYELKGIDLKIMRAYPHSG